MKLVHWALLSIAGLLGILTVTEATAQTALIPYIVSNTIGFTQLAVQVPLNLSSVSLVDRGYINEDGLNTTVEQNGVSVGYMPGTLEVRVLACFNDLAVDETTECNEDTPGDVTLPSALTEVYEFAGDNQFRSLWFNISTSTNAIWELEWQYYDGVSYVAFDDVVDGTNAFTLGGLHNVVWAFPEAGAWPKAELHSIEGYWVRVEVTSFTSLTVPPLGRQVWYETGRWWVLAESLAETEQQQYDVRLLISPDPKDFHFYFPHPDGIVVADDATLEVTGSAVKVFKGYFDVTAPVTGSKSIAFKEDSFEVTIPSDGIIQVEVFPAP